MVDTRSSRTQRIASAKCDRPTESAGAGGGLLDGDATQTRGQPERRQVGAETEAERLVDVEEEQQKQRGAHDHRDEERRRLARHRPCNEHQWRIQRPDFAKYLTISRTMYSSFRFHYMDFPDCLLLLLSISVFFYFLVFLFLHFFSCRFRAVD